MDNRLLSHLSPLRWEHINLTGDYNWRQNKQSNSAISDPYRRSVGLGVLLFFRFVK